MRPRSRPRLLVARLVAVAALLAACSPTGATTATPSPTVDAAAVNRTLAEVADARAAAADAVDGVLRAGLAVEPVAQRLRSPSEVDAALDEVPPLVARFDTSDPAAAAAALDRLDTALAEAGAAVVGTLAEAPPDSWEQRFLTAQQAVLLELTSWSAASRDVQAVAARHWELWGGVVDDAAAFDDNRWRYRTEEEAAGTWEIEVAGTVGALGPAREELEAASTVRDAAAMSVAAADEHAAEVFASRPTAP